jgi:predicted SprT family Zn-dependent metalloprotease
MELREAETLAVELMNEYGLIEEGWTFKFDNAKRRFGLCSHRRKVISLSRYLVSLNGEWDVRDTILHEIAHALVGRNVHHGPTWQQMAARIGAMPTRCYDKTVEQPTAKWEGRCPGCGKRITRLRRKDISCGQCSKSYDPRFKFVWTELPEHVRISRP